MNEDRWISWKMQTSKQWSDIEDCVKLINIDFIDHDHRILANYALQVNKVVDNLEKEFTLERVKETQELLTQLYNYAVAHFNREEIFMTRYHLPNDDVHKREHAKILGMLKNAIDDFNKGKIKVSQKLKTQIMHWLIQHINITDYNFFNIENWSKNLVSASDWNDVKEIIRLTGISEIDRQHKILTTLAIDVMTKIAASPSPEIIHLEFEKFRNYALEHFEYETNFMATYNIKETDEHLKLHDYFIQRLNEFPEEIINDISRLNTMKTWILSWWIDHINSTDKETFDYKRWAYKLIEEATSLNDVAYILRRTGYEEIDQDHLDLMEVTLRLNQLITDYTNKGENLQSQSVKAEIVAIFNEIYDVAFSHFEREKGIMKELNLLDVQKHHEEHREILKKFNEIKFNYIEDRLYISTNIKTMILEWWLHHTNTIDYRTFVQNNPHHTNSTIEGGW